MRKNTSFSTRNFRMAARPWVPQTGLDLAGEGKNRCLCVTQSAKTKHLRGFRLSRYDRAVEKTTRIQRSGHSESNRRREAGKRAMAGNASESGILRRAEAGREIGCLRPR